MQISERIIWIFSQSYIPRKNSFIDRQSKILFFSPIIFIFGIVRITQLYLIQKSTIKKIPDHLVVQSAAPHMHMKYFKLFNRNSDSSKYIMIDCFDKKQFTQIIKLNFWDIYLEFYLSFKELIPMLSKLKKDEYRKLKLSEAMVSLPVFAYFTCLFKTLKKKNSKIKIFSGGAHMISAAAITASIPAYWLSHGLLGHAKLKDMDVEVNPKKYFIAFPDYEYIYLHSKNEMEYLYDHGISSHIKLYDNYKKIKDLQNKIIIFLITLDEMMDKQVLKMVIELFQKNEFQIIIKFHPSYIGSLHQEFMNDKNIIINKSFSASASELMHQEKPKFVASWASTTLCEALQLGIAPICLCNNREEEEVIFPFRQKTIWWQEDQEKLSKFISDTDENSLNKFIEKINAL